MDAPTRMNKVNNNSDGLEEIENSILDAFIGISAEYDSLPKPHENRTITWVTKTIKERIGNIGYENKYEVTSSIHDGEWHYDLVWYKNNKTGNLEKVILSLESELSDRNPQGLNDFEKLLVSNSDYKVWICFNKGNLNYPENVNELIQKYDKAVSSYMNLKLDSRILILIWADYEAGHIISHLIIKK